jgi:alpha-1,2-mannosyltransferase
VAGFVGAGRRAGQWFVFGLIPVLAFCWWIAFSAFHPSGDWGFDFQQFWQGGNDVVRGISPYPAVPPSASDQYDFYDVRTEFRFPYPAGAALVFARFGVLGVDTASVVWGAVIIASLVGAIWILGIRDWRVAGVVLGSPAVIGAVRPGTLTPVLMLLLAAAWRWRDRRWLVAGSLGSAIALKLFLWPLVFWLVATRRFAAAFSTAALRPRSRSARGPSSASTV